MTAPPFDTKIVIVVRDDLLMWQKLNVTAFLASGVVGDQAERLGDPYVDADGVRYRPMIRQPVIVLSADPDGLKKIHARGIARGVEMAVYIEDMFATGNDVDNRAAVQRWTTEALQPVGLAFHADKKIADKISKGAKMHG